MYSKLGDIIFEGLIGPSSFEMKEETNYAEHELINVKPRLQRIGEKLTEIKIDMFFSATFCDVEENINALTSHRIDGSILPLVIGTGEFVGDFVIKSINRSVKQTDKVGKIIEAELAITLLEYSPSVSEESQQAMSDGFANEDNSPIELEYVPLRQSEAMELQLQQVDILSNVTLLSANLDDAKKQPSAAAKFLKKSGDALKKATEALRKMRDQIQKVKNVIQSAERIKKALEDSIRYAERAKKALEDGDVDGAIQASNELIAGTSRLKYANSETAALVATRKSTFARQ